MASIKTTIKQCMLRYPTLFSDQFDVMHHLFLVIGNGYQWVDGELCENDQAEPVVFEQARVVLASRQKLIESARKAEASLPGSEFSKEMSRRVADFDVVAQNIDALCEDLGSVELAAQARLYPCCSDCAKIFRVPDDAKADWLLAIRSFAKSCIVLSGKHAGASNVSMEDQKSAKDYLVHLPKAVDRIDGLLAKVQSKEP